MISTINKRLGVHAAREEMRLPSEAEVNDRSYERFLFGAAGVLVAIAFLSWSTGAGLSVADAVMMIGPFVFALAGFVSRKCRLRKLDRRIKILTPQSNIERANG